jgi:S-adenosylmethionine hydrolase
MTEKIKKYQQIVVLMTDFGLKSSYVAQMKGAMLSINPNLNIVDLTHGISPQNIKEAAFVIGGSYKFFPKNTIFVCVVDPEVGMLRKIILLKADGFYFIAPDNGLLTLVLEKEKEKEIFSLENDKYFLEKISPTFHGRDIFAPVAAYLSLGTELNEFGPIMQDINKMKLKELIVTEKEIQGEIIFMDRFGNAVTNIEGDYLLEKNIDFTSLVIKFKGYYVIGISKSYSEKGIGELLALIGSNGYLEIAINKGSAEEECGIKVGDKVKLSINK